MYSSVTVSLAFMFGKFLEGTFKFHVFYTIIITPHAQDVQEFLDLFEEVKAICYSGHTQLLSSHAEREQLLAHNT